MRISDHCLSFNLSSRTSTSAYLWPRKLAWDNFCRRVYNVDESLNLVASRQTTTVNGDGDMAGFCETNVTDKGKLCLAKYGKWMFIVL